jgi:hypothetical protein
MWGSVGQEGMPSVDGSVSHSGRRGHLSPLPWLEFQSTTKMAILSERVHQLPARNESPRSAIELCVAPGNNVAVAAAEEI